MGAATTTARETRPLTLQSPLDYVPDTASDPFPFIHCSTPRTPSLPFSISHPCIGMHLENSHLLTTKNTCTIIYLLAV